MHWVAALVILSEDIECMGGFVESLLNGSFNAETAFCCSVNFTLLSLAVYLCPYIQ
ncbi:MAG: hypothetical protein ACI82S_002154 [Patiriisocius sp.]|jgi:hypothetical protein